MFHPQTLAIPFLLVGLQDAPSQSPQESWRRLTTGCDELIVDLDFADAQRGFVVGGDREEGTPALLLRTDDGGESWRRIDLDIETRLYSVHFPTPRVGYTVGLGGTALETADGGDTWTALDCGVDDWLAAVHFTSVETGYVAGDSGILVTTDGGATWRPAFGGDSRRTKGLRLRDLVFLDRDVGYAVGGGGAILRTEDAGRTWQRLHSGVDAWLRSVHFVDRRTGFVGGSGVLLTTTDGGASWRELAHPREKLNDVLFLDTKRGYTVTMEGRLWRTMDGGASWELDFENEGSALTSLRFPVHGAGFAAGDGGTLLALAP